jgi:hypothetical protein
MEYTNIHDIEDKINLLYDYNYNINSASCYNFVKIKPAEISIDDIKISIDEDDDFYNSNLKKILSNKLKFEFFDENELIFFFKRYSDQFSVDIKILFYKNENDINNINSPINLDSLFSYLLSELVLSKKTKHILLPIINIDINYNQIIKLIQDEYINNKIKKSLLNNDITNICCLQVREHFFKNDLLINFLNNNEDLTSIYKTLLFQLIYTLATINKEYNNFKHNNLILKNIMVYLKKPNDFFTKYPDIFDNQIIYYINNKGFDIKIMNFEKAYIPKLYGILSDDNSDLYTFLLDLEENVKNKNYDKETNKFINKILKSKKHNYYNLLKDEYFNEFLENNSVDDTNSIYNTEYLLGRNIRIIKSYDEFEETEKSMNNKIKISKTNIMTSKYKRYLKQKGGDNNKPENLPFRVEKNTPFMSNDQKRIIKERNLENPINKEPPILFEQKIYDPSANKPPQKPQPQPFIPLYNPENMIYPYTNMGIPQQPVYKTYNISLSNPLGNYTTLNRVFEDVLPGEPNTYTALTLFERIQLVNYLRNILLDSNDGEEMTISGGSNSLLSYIKLMDINPYGINKNPYYDLPRNFLLYRGAYPIRFDEKNKTIGLSKQAMGINIRMYMMSIGDLICLKINKEIDSEDFDLWRELKYYDYIRDIIVKRKISPNFIIPILYKIDSKSKIDWSQLEQIKRKDYAPGSLEYIKENQLLINNKHNLDAKLGPFQNMLTNQYKRMISKPKVDIDITLTLDPNDKENILINSGKSLILLTEAPTSSLIQWTSVLYDSFGTVKKMVSTGYHSKDIWESIIFQLIYGMAVLQESEIYIENLSLNDNFYIKDIYYDANSIGSWIYKVDDINYYIPNYGYILLIDSKYNDIDISFPLAIKNKIDKLKQEKQFKIYGKNLFTNNTIYKNINFKSKIHTQFVNLINPDNFTRKLKVLKGSVPDDFIIDFFRNIFNNNTLINIKDYLYTYFKSFLHNRIGTYLYKTEKDNANLGLIVNRNFKKGEILIYEKNAGEYMWVLYVDSINIWSSLILNKDNNNYIEETINNHSLYPYYDKISQDSKKNMKFDENNIFETYIFNNIN